MTRVFIVHGQPELPALKLRTFLASLDLTPILLEEQDDRGLTIIEKFEYYASACEVAFTVMTPDDELIDSARQHSRIKAARQNVLLELGWFVRHLGRSRVIILHQAGTDTPSDISGILYLSFERDILEVSEKIRTRLRGLGIGSSSM